MLTKIQHLHFPTYNQHSIEIPVYYPLSFMSAEEPAFPLKGDETLKPLSYLLNYVHRPTKQDTTNLSPQSTTLPFLAPSDNCPPSSNVLEFFPCFQMKEWHNVINMRLMIVIYHQITLFECLQIHGLFSINWFMTLADAFLSYIKLCYTVQKLF